MKYPRRFGALYRNDKTLFSLWAPSSEEVRLNLYRLGDKSQESEPYQCVDMELDEDGVFSVSLDGDLNGVYYDFLIKYKNGDKVKSADPWAVACGVNGSRSMVIDLRTTDPEGWNEDERIGKVKNPVVWETHVSDFSYSEHSGIPKEIRGKYKAFTITDSTVDGKGVYPTCLNHIKRLGVTHVQLQPIADIVTIDECKDTDYNWGYDIGNYNCPEGSYSTDPYNGEVRIREFKELVQALHQQGIGVILDVVYNHTFYKKSWLSRTAPGEYYRHSEDGSYLNASGCGCETASERMPFRNYMIQSILYWAKEYHVDGFRFDLMGIHDIETMRLIREELDKLPNGKSILTYGEPWSCLPVGLKEPDIPADKWHACLLPERVGIFCDNIRNTVVGVTSNPYEEGYVSGKWEDWHKDALKSGICSECIQEYGKEINSPAQAVQYVSCHDNYTLHDRLVIQNDSYAFEGGDEVVMKRTRFASGIYMTCAGISFMLSGEELSRTKHGDGNSYKGPGERNQINWSRAETHAELVEWYQGLIALHKELFTLEVEDAVNTKFFDTPDDRMISFERPAAKSSKWDSFWVVYNPGFEDVSVLLPEGNWHVLCDGCCSSMDESVGDAKEYVVPGISIVILAK